MAIEQGLTILNWHENLPSEEVPPEHLWEDGEGLEQWWKHVEQKREDGGVSTGRGRELSRDDDDDGDPRPGMAENDYARYLTQG